MKEHQKKQAKDRKRDLSNIYLQNRHNDATDQYELAYTINLDPLADPFLQKMNYIISIKNYRGVQQRKTLATIILSS